MCQATSKRPEIQVTVEHIRLDLQPANTIQELILEEEDRRPVWQALRERASHTQRYEADIPGVEIDAALLAALLGLKQ